MNVTIFPRPLSGAVAVPPSKSQAHRLLLAAALAQGDSTLTHLACSQDIEATLRCLEALGGSFDRGETSLTVHGMEAGPMSPLRRLALPRLDCGESGSTLRFLIPVALAVRGGGSFTGRGRLMERPQQPYFDLFRQKDVFYEQKDGVLTVQGQLTPGRYELPGDVSSQFVTGLLYALPLLDGDSDLVLTSPLESKGYVDMTLLALAAFGVTVQETAEGYRIPGGQRFRPAALAVEGDYSQAGFYLAANAAGSRVEVQGLAPDSAQGDRVAVPYCQALAAPGEVTLDVSQCPDLVPPLAACAALRQAGSVTRLVGAARLRIKESDRLASVTAVLNALGGQVEEGPDSLTITGRDGLAGGVTVDCFRDHRIAMMAAVAATRCAAPVTLTGAECVAKSYPNFWEDYAALGGRITRTEG
jgi:3-phosphoshikimate 1-carboxyvinyltransferase